jgi:hypothetical protein
VFFSVRHGIHGREISKIESKEMRDICIVKFGNTVKAGNCLNIVFVSLMSSCIVVLFLACFK